MKPGDNVRLRQDGRYEARYIKGRDEHGKIIYGYCYGRSYDEAIEKREYQIHRKALNEMKKLNLLILGAGVHGEDVFEIAKELRVFNKVDFLDDNPFLDNVIGKWDDIEKLRDEYPVAIVAVADEDTRKKWTTKLIERGFVIPTLIHPTSYIADGVSVGVGTVIGARVTISVAASVGEHCIVTSGSTIPRKTVLPDWAYYEIDGWTYHKEKYEIPTVSVKGE